VAAVNGAGTALPELDAGAETSFLRHVILKPQKFATTGSGQTSGNVLKQRHTFLLSAGSVVLLPVEVSQYIGFDVVLQTLDDTAQVRETGLFGATFLV
jgi:hypothetical protein